MPHMGCPVCFEDQFHICEIWGQMKASTYYIIVISSDFSDLAFWIKKHIHIQSLINMID